MNRSIIRYILGCVLTVEGLLMLTVCGAALWYGEAQGWTYLAVGGGAALLGLLLIRKKPASTVFYLKEGCVSTALSWMLMSLVGCLPLYLTGEIPGFTDALFETVSGFTTTGASILSDVEALSHCALLWRSLTHWIGGMGVLVFLLAVVPLNGGYHMNLMRAESPGPSVGKLVPKVRATARILYLIYIGMTALELLLLLLGRMPTFEAICTSMATAANFCGLAGFSKWVLIFDMLAGRLELFPVLILFHPALWKDALASRRRK